MGLVWVTESFSAITPRQTGRMRMIVRKQSSVDERILETKGTP